MFENVKERTTDGRRTPDHGYPISSGELKKTCYIYNWKRVAINVKIKLSKFYHRYANQLIAYYLSTIAHTFKRF